MKRALIDPAKCNNCQPCVVLENCPTNAAFREDAEDKPWIDFYHCRGCMKCKSLCEYQAIIEETKPCDGGLAKSW